MPETDISIPADLTPDEWVSSVESALSASGLTVTLRTSLWTLPGSTHWHLRRGDARGTLELTCWPSRRRVWFTVRPSRAAAWIDERIDWIAGRLSGTDAAEACL